MPEPSDSRFPPEQSAYGRRERLSCFSAFFGESVVDALGVVLPEPSANKCQDCPDAEICFRLSLLKRLEQVAAQQRQLLDRLGTPPTDSDGRPL